MKRVQINKLDFKGQNIYVGIDVHLKSWSVAVLSEHSVLKKFSQNPNAEALFKFLATSYPGAHYHSVYEAGFCGFWIHERLVSLGINNIVVNPADVPTMSKEKLRKTDAVDCSKLARELRSGTLKGIYVPNVETLEIRSLIRLRNSIVKDSTREKNRIKSLLHFYGIKIPEEFTKHSVGNWSKRFLAWLRSVELSSEYGRKALDLHIEQYVRLRGMLLEETREIRKLSRTELFADSLKLITTIPGIGTTTGISLLTEIDKITRFASSEQLAAYIGLIPMCHSSGDKQGIGGITKRGHAYLRWILIQAARKAVQCDPAMTLFYEENCKRMHGNKAIVKVARKLVNRIYFVLKRKTEYVKKVV